MFAEAYGNCTNPSGTWYATWGWTNQPNVPQFQEGPQWGGRPMCQGVNCIFQIQPVSTAAPNPGQIVCDPSVPQTAHTGGMQVCLGDASVRAVNAGVSSTTWYQASTPAGGEPLQSDWIQ
jgi:hypothetical protein